MICEGKLKKETVEYKVYGESIGKFPAKVCSQCGEQWFSEDTAKEIEKAEKEAGVFGLSKETKISYSGNSLIVRIPKKLAEFMDMDKETEVILYPEDKNRLCVSKK